MDEVEALLDKAHKRLSAAKDLMNLGHYEDCANRSYYAMVAAAMAALRFKSVLTKTHKGLHSKFNEIFIKSGEIEVKYGKYFKYAEDVRNKVDYDSFETITEEKAQAILDEAEEFVSAIESLRSKV